MKELSNWGRWGKDDQLGTVNLITPEKHKQAAALVKSGIVVSLAPETMPGKIGGSVPGPPSSSARRTVQSSALACQPAIVRLPEPIATRA